MATTYAQRLAEVNRLQTAGLGLVAWAEVDADRVWVKDPDHVVATDESKVPEAGQLTTNTWVSWAGGDAELAYDLVQP